MSQKLDLTDKLKLLTDDQRRYVEFCLSGTKMSDYDLENVFGRQGLDELRTNIPLRKMISELKMDRISRKHLVDEFKLKETVTLIPLALKTMVEIMQSGSEGARLDAAKTILRPVLAFLEKRGIAQAELESVYASEDVESGGSFDPASVGSKALKMLLTER